jgi:hypothetical protein
MKKIAVFYYTQSGQALEVIKNVCKPFEEAGDKIIYKEILPEKPFPFPWTCMEFFEVFPETRLSIPVSEIKTIDLSDIEDADLVMISNSPWYLSPSQPMLAFFQNEKIKSYLKGKNIVNVSVCRNMWVMAQRKIRKYIYETGGNYVGNIVLQDQAPNLISVLTIVRWLFYNKKEAGRVLPAAGVSDKDLESASRFGIIIRQIMENGEWSDLQNKLMQADAIKYKPGVIFVERAGHRIFEVWANFIHKKGGYQNPKRKFRVLLFCIYLFFVLYVASPFGLAVYYLTYPFRIWSIKKHRQEMCYDLSWDETKKIQ